jgi:hypothetical protein
MDETALRLSISGFEQQLSSLEWWLYAWTLLVIVGCAGELYFVLHVYQEDKILWHRARTRGAVAPPEKPSAFVLIFELLSVAFVVVGISGELQIDRKSGEVQTKLRDANSQLVLLLEREAGAAKDSAKKAAAAAGTAKSSADSALLAAGDAQKKVATVGKEADTIEYILSARRVQDEEGLENDLENEFKDKNIVFKSYAAAQDPESFWLCAQLVDIAHKAGVNSTDECATEPLSRIPITDLLISAPTHDEAFSLSRVLKKPRRVTGYFVGLNEAPQLTVLVGVKQSLPLWPRAKKDTSKAVTKPKP